jgi:hypothetical protein
VISAPIMEGVFEFEEELEDKKAKFQREEEGLL